MTMANVTTSPPSMLITLLRMGTLVTLVSVRNRVLLSRGHALPGGENGMCDAGDGTNTALGCVVATAPLVMVMMGSIRMIVSVVDESCWPAWLPRMPSVEYPTICSGVPSAKLMRSATCTVNRRSTIDHCELGSEYGENVKSTRLEAFEATIEGPILVSAKYVSFGPNFPWPSGGAAADTLLMNVCSTSTGMSGYGRKNV